MTKGDDAYWTSLRSGETSQTPAQTEAAAKALLRRIGLEEGQALSAIDGEDGEQAWEALDQHFQKALPAYAEIREAMAHAEVSWDEATAELDVVSRAALKLLHQPPKANGPKLSEVLERYLAKHDNGDNHRFKTRTTTDINVVIQTAGDLPIKAYTRQNAETVLEVLASGGRKTETIRRMLNSIIAVFNFAINRMHIEFINPFQKQHIKRLGKDSLKREPFTAEELQAIAAACRAKNDQPRWIVAMMLDTGARMSEIAGLRRDDVCLEGPIPYIQITPHYELGRTLKTETSNRRVPLVGEALWAATQAKGPDPKSDWLFPQYAADNDIRGGHAAATINKWLKVLLGGRKTSHSFRHTMRDRLRAAYVQASIQDAIGGWGKQTIGDGYGAGYGLAQLHQEMLKVVLPKAPGADLSSSEPA